MALFITPRASSEARARAVSLIGLGCYFFSFFLKNAFLLLQQSGCSVGHNWSNYWYNQFMFSFFLFCDQISDLSSFTFFPKPWCFKALNSILVGKPVRSCIYSIEMMLLALFMFACHWSLICKVNITSQNMLHECCSPKMLNDLCNAILFTFHFRKSM